MASYLAQRRQRDFPPLLEALAQVQARLTGPCPGRLVPGHASAGLGSECVEHTHNLIEHFLLITHHNLRLSYYYHHRSAESRTAETAAQN